MCPTAERLTTADLDAYPQLWKTIAAVLAEHPQEIVLYQAGTTQLKGFFVGQVMKKLHGSANPITIRSYLDSILDS